MPMAQKGFMPKEQGRSPFFFRTPWWVISAGLHIAALYMFSQAVREDREFEKLFEQTVDTNRDGIPSPEEWGRVYRSFGLTYDPANPGPLTREQMHHYLVAPDISDTLRN